MSRHKCTLGSNNHVRQNSTTNESMYIDQLVGRRSNIVGLYGQQCCKKMSFLTHFCAKDAYFRMKSMYNCSYQLRSGESVLTDRQEWLYRLQSFLNQYNGSLFFFYFIIYTYIVLCLNVSWRNDVKSEPQQTHLYIHQLYYWPPDEQVLIAGIQCPRSDSPFENGNIVS